MPPSVPTEESHDAENLMGKNGPELHELLFAKGVNFNDYPVEFKRGVHVQRRRVRRQLTSPERESPFLQGGEDVTVLANLICPLSGF